MTLVQAEFALPGGITLRALRTPPPPAAAPKVMFLHGFPEGAFVWEPVLQALAGQVDAVAPWLRGYAPSSAPPQREAYRARALVGDLAALIESLGGPLDLLVAHDWGGALAWNLAASAPRLLRQLMIINAPHPALLLRELRQSPAQQQASAYMDTLCRDDALAGLRQDAWAPLLRFFGDARWLTEAQRERYRRQWDAGLQGPLNYYAASPLRAGDRAALEAVQLPRLLTHVPVPTTVLWGLRDHALLPGLIDGLEAYVPALRRVALPECSHWVLHEAPERVLQELRRALALPPR